MPSIVWLSRWRSLQARVRSTVPAPLRKLVPRAWRIRNESAWDLNAAERDPLFERYAHTRPPGPLRLHIGVTASPHIAEARSLAAAAADLGGSVTFFDPDDVDWAKQVREAGCDGHLLRVRHGRTSDWSLDQARLAHLHLLGTPTWPTPSEAFLYEDKARFTWWLAARGVPHVPTYTFVRLDAAYAIPSTPPRTRWSSRRVTIPGATASSASRTAARPARSHASSCRGASIAAASLMGATRSTAA